MYVWSDYFSSPRPVARSLVQRRPGAYFEKQLSAQYANMQAQLQQFGEINDREEEVSWAQKKEYE